MAASQQVKVMPKPSRRVSGQASRSKREIWVNPACSKEMAVDKPAIPQPTIAMAASFSRRPAVLLLLLLKQIIQL